MDKIRARGLVTRRSDYGESNCILTIMAYGLGQLSVCAYGVRSRRSKMYACTQVLCYAEFQLSKGRGDLYRIDEAQIIDGFYPICEDVVKLSLANYIIDAAREAYSDRDERILTLCLNTLYVIAYRDFDIMTAKAVFELKLMQYSGYEPQLGECMVCGGTDNLAAFEFSGGMVCSSCANSAAMNISPDTLDAVRYILGADDKHIFSFTASQAVKDNLSLLAEGYFLNKSERKYKSLDYFKKMV